MEVRIHPKQMINGVSYTIVSRSSGTSRPWPRAVIGFQIHSLPKDHLSLVCGYDEKTLTWNYVQPVTYQNKLYHVITYKQQMEYYPVGWIGCSEFPGWESVYDNNLDKMLTFAHLIPEEYFKAIPGISSDEDDCASYTQGYREGCTGLRWL